MNLDSPYALALAACVGLAAFVWQSCFQRCRRCGGRLRLDEIRDPWGVNLSKKVTISIFQTPRRCTQTWNCRACGQVEVREVSG